MGDLEVKYVPTGEMRSGVLTKPLQGQGFNRIRDQIMKVSEIYDDEMDQAIFTYVHDLSSHTLESLTL